MKSSVQLQFFTTLLLANLVVCILQIQPSIYDDNDLPETFNWSSITPSAKLKYHKCYDGYECARLLVPLDWTNKTNPNEVALAITRFPAQVSKSDKSFGGTILLNPGGPSGSGVNLVRWIARGVQEIVDGDSKFEILSWDPRGVKYTTPSSSCFASDKARDSLIQRGTAVGAVDESVTGFNTKWAQALGVGELCSTTNLGTFEDGSNIRQYASTALVAHDMIAIIDSVEEEKTQELFGALPPGRHQTVIQERASEQKQPALLYYWGYSYGTFLGNTFASMFPSRVGRMILDGVVDAPDYSATGWKSNLQDNMLLWDYFFEWCYEAGQKCALYDPTYSGVDDLKSRVRRFLDTLKENPLTLVTNGEVTLLNRYEVLVQMHLAGYGPYQHWPNLAIKLAALIQEDSIATNELWFHPTQKFPSLDPFNNRSQAFPPSYPHSWEAAMTILCGDGDEISPPSKAEFSDYFDQLSNQSSIIAPVWAEITIKCRHWSKKIRPAENNRFTGPFASNLSDYDSRASPILFIGNTADPVTPLRNAYAMSERHEGSRVLVQDSPGHCSGPHIPSKCLWNEVKSFFNTGTLPKLGTECPVDWKVWDRHGP